MSGEGFIAADPERAVSYAITHRLGAVRAAEAGAGVAPWPLRPPIINQLSSNRVLRPRRARDRRVVGVPRPV